MYFNESENDKSSSSNVKKAILMALFIAMFVVFSVFVTFNFLGAKVTLQNLPLFVGAITLGTVPGSFIGFAGMLLNQMLTYGFTPTTIIWVLPHTIVGGLTGYIFEKKIVNVGGGLKFWVAIIFIQLLLTVLNTIAYLIDALVFGYYNYMLIFGTLIFRLMLCVLTSIVYCCIIPTIVNITKKIH